MLSIIICSRIKKINSILANNINDTVDCNHEMIVIDNSENKYSIFEAYNEGIRQSNGDYWCFIHDDVLFHTQGWGNKILEIFKSDKQIGLLGIAGAKVKTKTPSAWWNCNDQEKVMHLQQHLENGKIEYWDLGWGKSSLEEVVVIDGLFMVAKSHENIRFNEHLKGFHNYDLDLSLIYKKQNFKVVVTKSILIEHFSFGTINQTWCTSSINFTNHYKKVLPLQVKGTLNNKQFKQLELKNAKLFCDKLLTYNLRKQAFFYWLRLIWLNPKSKYHFKFVKNILK